MVETNTEAKAVEKVKLELAGEAKRIWRLRRGRREERGRERENRKRRRRSRRRKTRKQGSRAEN